MEIKHQSLQKCVPGILGPTWQYSVMNCPWYTVGGPLILIFSGGAEKKDLDKLNQIKTIITVFQSIYARKFSSLFSFSIFQDLCQKTLPTNWAPAFSFRLPNLNILVYKVFVFRFLFINWPGHFWPEHSDILGSVLLLSSFPSIWQNFPPKVLLHFLCWVL